MKILEKTMNEMPNTFSSHEFNKRAVENGFPAEKIKTNGGLNNFIRRYADNAYYRSKTWVKRNKNKKSQYNTGIISESEMIKYLKSKGYKIMKPVNEWVEC